MTVSIGAIGALTNRSFLIFLHCYRLAFEKPTKYDIGVDVIINHIDLDLWERDSTLLISTGYGIYTTNCNETSLIVGSADFGYMEGKSTNVKFRNLNKFIQVEEGYSDIIVLDSGNHILRIVDRKTNTTTHLAGSPGSSGSTDGSATVAKFSYPISIVKHKWATRFENYFVADFYGKRLRRFENTRKWVWTVSRLPRHNYLALAWDDQNLIATHGNGYLSYRYINKTSWFIKNVSISDVKSIFDIVPIRHDSSNAQLFLATDFFKRKLLILNPGYDDKPYTVCYSDNDGEFVILPINQTCSNTHVEPVSLLGIRRNEKLYLYISLLKGGILFIPCKFIILDHFLCYTTFTLCCLYKTLKL